MAAVVTARRARAKSRVGWRDVTPRYFDHNATTPLLPEVVDAMLPYLTTHFGNPSSGHVYGRTAKQAVERAREQVASLVGAQGSEVTFTSGGTEATALALRGTFLASTRRQVVTSSVEHPATARLAETLVRDGASWTQVGVDTRGLLKPLHLREDTLWVSVIHAHNETGVLQDLASLSRVAHAGGALLHADASQSAGKVPLDVRRDGVDLLTLAAHKLYAPKGVGALVHATGVRLLPTQVGAGHEAGLRAGTENVASIVGFGAACVAAQRDLADLSARLLTLRTRLERGLRDAVGGVVIAGEGAPRLPNTVYALFPRVTGAALLARSPGVAASTGSACHDGIEHPATVLTEMGVDPALAVGAVRLSMGRATSTDDVDAVIIELAASWRALTC
jgi:cysteine desulfurase